MKKLLAMLLLVATPLTLSAQTFGILYYRVSPTLSSSQTYPNGSGWTRVAKLEMKASNDSVGVNSLAVKMAFDCSLRCGYTTRYYGSWLQDTKMELRDSRGHVIANGVRREGSMVYDFVNNAPLKKAEQIPTGWFSDQFEEEAFFTKEDVVSSGAMMSVSDDKIAKYYLYIDFFNRKNRPFEITQGRNNIGKERYDITVLGMSVGENRTEEVRPGGGSIVIDYNNNPF